MNAPEKTTGASPIVFSTFTRTALPAMFGRRIMRTVLPLMDGVAARALCAVAHAVYQSFPPPSGAVAHPANAAMSTRTKPVHTFIAHSVRLDRREEGYHEFELSL